MSDKDDDQGSAPLPEDARLDSLEERLEKAQIREAERTGSGKSRIDENEAMGSRVLSYLLGGLFGGALFGWVVDQWADTGGLALIVGVILGIIGGFWSIVRITLGNKPKAGND